MAKRSVKENIPDEELRQEDLPGYPPYPPEDDIMRRADRVEGDPDEVAQKNSTAEPKESQPAADNSVQPTEKEDGSPGKYELTEEDLQALGPVDLSLDLGDDEQLKQRTQPVDFAGSELDVPGSELDDTAESTGSEDEENNPYSLGGDAHSDLEEGRQ